MTQNPFGEVVDLAVCHSFPKPCVLPPRGVHPRLLLNRSVLERLKTDLDAPENAAAMKETLALAEASCDGLLPDLSAEGKHNMDYRACAAAEARAFRYAMTGDSHYADEAVTIVKNLILTLNIPEGSLHDACRAFGFVMYTAALVYDWCYDRLTDDDRRDIVAGCETRLAPFMEVKMPPLGQGMVTGHGAEAQIHRDWLSLGIAVYDEYPDIYELAAARTLGDYREAGSFYIRSGSHWQGSAYGQCRYYFMITAQILLSRMTDGAFELFPAELEEAAENFLHHLRPDGEMFRNGDDYNEKGKTYTLSGVAKCSFLAASCYKNEVLKTYARRHMKDFTDFPLSYASVTPVNFLLNNDPSTPSDSGKRLAPSHYCRSPLGCITARTGFDENAAAVYMKIGEAYSANHEHKDAGCFQIFYKGILASDSGIYDAYGSPEDYSYNKQTISSNCLLVFNPAMTDNGKWIYSGGQTIAGNANGENPNLAAWMSKRTVRQAKILGHAVDETPDGFRLAYLAGDLTNAYDPETVVSYDRHMLALNAGDAAHPLIFVVFDRVTAADASFQKTFLLHTQSEPRLADGFAVIEHKGGRLTAQSCVTPTDLRAVGGKGHEFDVNGVNYPLARPNAGDGTVAEIGWGRVEFTPCRAEKTDRLVTVLTVSDAGTDETPVKAVSVGSASEGAVVGAMIFGEAVLFPREKDSFASGFAFRLPEGTAECLICGVPAGDWKIASAEKTALLNVPEDGGVLRFPASAGEMSVSRV